MSEFLEDSRVKFPALIHMVGMGFEYISSNNSAKPQEQQEPYDPLTNILTDKFKEAFLSLNPELKEEDAEKKLAEIQTSVGYNDLGRHFYKEILMEPGLGRIVDFSSEKAFRENNTFQVTTEMTCGSKKDDNFRPDITIFVNGLPLAFIEVKPDNNHEGIQAEAKRMKVRFQNPKFRRYINITQMMMFSNDMEYDTDNVVPTQGAFYATTGLLNTKYNLFREEGQDSFPISQSVRFIPKEQIEYILSDNNKQSFRSADRFLRLLETLGPTKRMINSLFTFERFLEYKYIKIRDCLSLITNGFVIKQSRGSEKAGGLPFTRIETLSNGIFNRDRMGYANIYDIKGIESYVLEDEDILISHINSRRFLGRAVLYKKKGNEIILHGMNVLRIKTNPKILNPIYASFLFQTSYYKNCIDNIRKDAINQSSFSISDFQNLTFPLPDIKYQEKIAHFIFLFEKKISLNRAINKNLEALAKQIYDYWFVQFDFPDENGRPYKSSGGKMVWNKDLNREIPSQFRLEQIGQHTKVLLGGTPDTQNTNYWDGTYPWLNSGEVAEFPIISSEKNITEEGLNSSATVYAPKGSVTLSITRHLRPSILAIDACINQSVVAIKETEEIRKEYLYPFIKRDIPRLMTLRTGAQQPHINKETVDKTWLVIPDKNTLSKYYDITKPIYENIINNAFEMASLTKQRDELLPLLMNGQVIIDN